MSSEKGALSWLSVLPIEEQLIHLGWTHFVGGTCIPQASNDLCSSLALVAKHLCTDMVDPNGLSTFVACRLIALDKCLGVRPIGVGKVVRGIVGKAVLATLKMDILEAAGPLQLCAGQDAGCKAAIHAMRSVFNEEDTETVLLVDASDAFNSLNHKAALHYIRIYIVSFLSHNSDQHL